MSVPDNLTTPVRVKDYCRIVGYAGLRDDNCAVKSSSGYTYAMQNRAKAALQIDKPTFHRRYYPPQVGMQKSTA